VLQPLVTKIASDVEERKGDEAEAMALDEVLDEIAYRQRLCVEPCHV
jgi:hypothetical protein